MKPRKKPWSQMTTSQLRRATKEFDNPNYHPPALPWTKEDRKVQGQARQFGRALKEGGRPRIGLGAQRLNISMERGLLSRLDAYARRHGMSRAAVLARSVQTLLDTAA